MTPRRLPPLRALLVFESAARHLSLTVAGAELLITEPAVSQQIKALERYFGKPLFVRLARGLALTADGIRLLEVASQCFNQIDDVSRTISGEARKRSVRLQVTPHFSTTWLAPRLERLDLTKRRILLTLVHNHLVLDSMDPEVDIAICWRNDALPGTVMEELFTTSYVPMCSPKLVEKLPRPISFDLLEKVPLFTHSDSISWDQWCSAFKIKTRPLSTAIHFENYDTLLEATVRGNGLSLLMRPMFTSHLDDGRLVAPFGADYAVPLKVSIVYRKTTLRRPEVAAVRDWLLRESMTSRA